MTISRFCLVFASLVFLPSLCAGQTTFTGAGDGTTWEDALNWDAGLPAGNNTNINNGFNVTLGSDATIAELDISGDQGPTGGVLDHSAGALTGSGWMKIGLGGNTGTYDLSGTASASGFSVATIGRGAGSVGDMSIAGSASFEAETIGFGEEGGTGNLVMSGGSLTASNGGLAFNTDSSLTFSDGMISANEVFVRDDATVNQTGGSLTSNQGSKSVMARMRFTTFRAAVLLLVSSRIG